MIARTPLLAAASALFALPVAEYPQNLYEEGAEWTQTFEETTAWELESMVQSINGVEVDIGTPSMRAELSRSFTLADVYDKVREGKLLERTREFADAEGEASMSLELMGQSEAHSADLGTPLEGLVAIGKWDEEAGAHRFSFEDEAGDVNWLERLDADAEFGLLASDEEVELEGSWTVDLADGSALFAPGGRLPWEAELSAGSYQMLQPQHVLAVCLMNLSDLADDVEGEVEVTWVETKTEAGNKTAVLALELEAVLSADLSAELARLSAAAGVPELPIVQEASVVLEGSGTVEWDLVAGHFRSLELELESTLDLTIEWTEGSEQIRVEVEMTGVTAWEAEARPTE